MLKNNTGLKPTEIKKMMSLLPFALANGLVKSIKLTGL